MALRGFITAQFSQLPATVKQEQDARVLEGDDLQAERFKLLQAHYAKAVPIDLLKYEQDRIGRRADDSGPPRGAGRGVEVSNR